MNITPKSLTVTQLLSGESEQYVVPPYQRRYSWRKKEVQELLDDISLLEGSDTHLLGSIVCLAGYHKAGINELEVVDGQQRLTTICILLQCIADRLIKDDKIGSVEDVSRLLKACALGESPVRKILLDSLDAAQFEQHFTGSDCVGPRNEDLARAFEIIREWIAGKSLKELRTFLYHLKNQCVVIRLDVSDSKDAFKLFETINNRGLRLSPADIIKNFTLGNAARFGDDSLQLARSKWAQLLKHLDGLDIDSFFRHFLCARLKRRVTISFVVGEFKKTFMRDVRESLQLPDRRFLIDDDPLVENEENGDDFERGTDEGDTVENSAGSMGSFAEFLDQIVTAASVFREIVSATTGKPVIDRRLTNLRRIKFAQSYGFLMSLRIGGCSDGEFAKVLRLTEAFLIRLHICRVRLSENEVLFAQLCGVDKKDPLPAVVEAFRRRSPTDVRFRQEFAVFDFHSYLIDRARYCLEQFELSSCGDYEEKILSGPDVVHVEHVIPIKIKTAKAKQEFGDWPKYLGDNSEALHPEYVSKIGNLTLLAEPLNIEASNNPYDSKKKTYQKSSIILTKNLHSRFPDFRFSDVEHRSSELADLAADVWPIP